MRRVCIYHIRETSASAAGYIRRTLSALAPYCARIVVVADEGWGRKLAGVRRVPTLKAAFSPPYLSDAQEALLLDDRWVGPISDLAPMFCAADAAQADVWQLAEDAPFFGLRAKAFKHPAFLAWAEQPVQPLWPALRRAKLETATLYDTPALRALTASPMLDEPLTMAETLGCPFFTHEIFHRDYDEVVQRTLGYAARDFYRYLTDTLHWDTDPLWDFLLATCHMEDLYRNLHLTYVVLARVSEREKTAQHLQTHKLALLMHLYYEDLIPQSLACAANFPPQTHVHITTDTAGKSAKIRRAFSHLNVAEVDVRVIPNRGRDVAALLVGFKDVVDRYAYVCTYHDKKVLQTKPGSVGVGFAYKITENLMPSEDFVYNVIRTFADNPRLGLLTPPPPHHSDYFFTLGTCWGINYAVSRDLKEKLGLKVPMAEDKQPIAPLGTCFWFRRGALSPLYRANWTYAHFQAEPNPPDGTMLHAVERLYPFAAQAAGFYSAYLLSDSYAPVEYTSLKHCVRGFHQVFFKNGILSYHHNMRDMVYQRLHAKSDLRLFLRETGGKVKRKLKALVRKRP